MRYKHHGDIEDLERLRLDGTKQAVEKDGVEKSTQDLTGVLAVEYLCTFVGVLPKNKTTPAGFEPALPKGNRFLIYRRNHLAMMSGLIDLMSGEGIKPQEIESDIKK
jgi:hypothetical protein